MSQADENSKRSRRTSRSQRNRPVLVTSTESQQSELASYQEAATLVEEPVSQPVPAPAPTSRRRLPNFFSTIGKSEQESPAKEDQVVKARIARATHGKGSAAPAKSTTSKEATKEESKPAARTTTPARPTSGFKTRYIVGMAIYLLAANFIGLFETQIVKNLGAERLLTQFNLFGGQIQIRTSTLIYLATLIIILVVLARLDLIPRSLSAAAGSSTSSRARTTQGGTNRENSEGTRTPPPTIRQGVKGADDNLYQQYRANQRREKKR